MSKANEIKKGMLSIVSKTMSEITDTINNCHLIEPTSLQKEYMYLLDNPSKYIKACKEYHKWMPDYVNKVRKECGIKLQKLSHIYNIDELLIETHFLHEFLDLHKFNPVIHRRFKESRFVNYGDEEIYVPSLVSTNLVNYAIENNKDIESYGDLFLKIEEPDYNVENKIFDSKLAGKIKVLSNKQIIKKG